jgi:hypothetical protein
MSRESLQDGDLRVGRHRVREPLPVGDRLAAHEDDHVPAQRALVVEHVAAHARVLREGSFQRLAHRRARHFLRRAVEVAPEVSAESHPRHGRILHRDMERG